MRKCKDGPSTWCPVYIWYHKICDLPDITVNILTRIWFEINAGAAMSTIVTNGWHTSYVFVSVSLSLSVPRSDASIGPHTAVMKLWIFFHYQREQGFCHGLLVSSLRIGQKYKDSIKLGFDLTYRISAERKRDCANETFWQEQFNTTPVMVLHTHVTFL